MSETIDHHGAFRELAGWASLPAATRWVSAPDLLRVATSTSCPAQSLWNVTPTIQPSAMLSFSHSWHPSRSALASSPMRQSTSSRERLNRLKSSLATRFVISHQNAVRADATTSRLHNAVTTSPLGVVHKGY